MLVHYKEITDLFSLCLEISTTTKHDVFFDYSPHCNLVTIMVHINGWVSGVGPDKNFRVYYDVGHKRRINKIMKYLKRLK